MKKKLLVLLVTSLAMCCLLEVTVRLFHLAPGIIRIEIEAPYGIFVSSANPILKYELKPGVGDINKHGFRDHVYPVEKAEGTFRILVLGDSIGFGFCLDDRALPLDRTFAKFLERDMNRPQLDAHEKVEVINLSVSGYDTAQEVELLRAKGLAFEPDLVVVAYCLNDAYDSSVELKTFKAHEEWKNIVRGPSRVLYLNSHLYRLVHYRVTSLVRQTGTSSSGDGQVGTRDDQGNGVGQEFDKLKSLSVAHDFATMVVVFPSFDDYTSYPNMWIHEMVRDEAARNDFFFLDLLGAFTEASRGDYTYLRRPCRGRHPNELGHELAAREVANFLSTNLDQGF